MKLFWLLLTTGICISCQTNLEHSFNDERKLMHIPIIPDSWEKEQVYSDVTRWVNPTPIQDTAVIGYSMKTVCVLEENLIKEQDIYFGSTSSNIKDISPAGSLFLDRRSLKGFGLKAIRIEYYYSYQKGKWRIDSTLYSIENGIWHQNSKNDLSIVEKTLSELGMSRLNY